ncbi:unnamed protein product [Leptosia nina]|uniref:Cytochrome b561 domain-containing protein n=1 Tax=Leptosia nina TaxID=320188 RepID=A0AAV1J217_9NEOP
MDITEETPESSLKDRRSKQERHRSPKRTPLRILIIEPSGKYCRSVWCAIGLGAVHIFIGATVMSVIIFSIKVGDTHAALCTIAMRMIIIDPVGEYWNVVLCAVAIGISQLLIGGVTTTLLVFILKTNSDIHVPLCVFGYHFFSAEAILSLNYANGWSTPMRLRHRRLTHMLLQLCAMALAITGTVLITMDKGISRSAHGLTGN